MVPVVTSDEALRLIGEGLRRAIAAEPFEADGALLALTASVGCVRAGRERWTAGSLVAAAYGALDDAKEGGRNRTRSAHDAPSEAPATADAGIETIASALALAAAIRDGLPAARAHQAAELAGLAAAALGLDLRSSGRASVAALLADAGPVAIDDDERTSLTADRVALADHALAVEDVVRRVAGLQDAAAVLRHQHERFDAAASRMRWPARTSRSRRRSWPRRWCWPRRATPTCSSCSPGRRARSGRRRGAADRGRAVARTDAVRSGVARPARFPYRDTSVRHIPMPLLSRGSS